MSDNIFNIEIEGLEPVIHKFENAQKTLNREMGKAMSMSLDVVQQEIPGYPPQRENQKTPYIRTGTLARSLGSGMGGGKSGVPTIYSVSGQGKDMLGQIGTNLSYAKYVIGDTTQAKMHKDWWWTFDFVARKAKEKIVALWERFIKEALDV